MILYFMLMLLQQRHLPLLSQRFVRLLLEVIFLGSVYISVTWFTVSFSVIIFCYLDSFFSKYMIENNNRGAFKAIVMEYHQVLPISFANSGSMGEFQVAMAAFHYREAPSGGSTAPPRGNAFKQSPCG